MTLSKRQKKALQGMMVAVIVIGLLLVLFPVFVKPIYPPEVIEKLRYSGEDVLVIIPRFTEAAYGEKGFYNYYDGTCGEECLDIPLNKGRADRWGSYNANTVQILKELGYPMMSDVDVHYNLMLDKKFLTYHDTIILLHSEYVTRELYDAITSHERVIYLSPNALYGEVTYNGLTMKLVRGHGYPDQSITNGFGWQHENTPEEYDTDCFMWKFREISNGWQLNCAQEIYTKQNPGILLKVKELINQ